MTENDIKKIIKDNFKLKKEKGNLDGFVYIFLHNDVELLACCVVLLDELTADSFVEIQHRYDKDEFEVTINEKPKYLFDYQTFTPVKIAKNTYYVVHNIKETK